MIAAIFAVDQNNGIGANGIIPWPRVREDMVWFKNKTQGQVVAMGKKTWDSGDMPSPLPGRVNVVFTSDTFDAPNTVCARGDVAETLIHLSGIYQGRNIYVIGGATVIEQARPACSRAFITRIPGNYNCDTFVDVDAFVKGMQLINTIDLGTCTVLEYEVIKE